MGEWQDSPREASVQECGWDGDELRFAVVVETAVVVREHQEVDVGAAAFRDKYEAASVELGVDVLTETNTILHVGGEEPRGKLVV